jgi:hypothetical protein
MCIYIKVPTVWQLLFIAIKPKQEYIFHTAVTLFLHHLQNIITITKTVYILRPIIMTRSYISGTSVTIASQICVPAKLLLKIAGHYNLPAWA